MVIREMLKKLIRERNQSQLDLLYKMNEWLLKSPNLALASNKTFPSDFNLLNFAVETLSTKNCFIIKLLPVYDFVDDLCLGQTWQK